MEITIALSIPDNELTFTFIRSSGPGGQNVNKLATAAQLRFDVQNSPSLPAEVKERLVKVAGTHMTQEGVLVIVAKRYRSQEQNRTDAEQRLNALLRKAANRPRVRHATKPSSSVQRKRLESKRKKADLKKQRRPLIE